MTQTHIHARTHLNVQCNSDINLPRDFTTNCENATLIKPVW